MGRNTVAPNVTLHGEMQAVLQEVGSEPMLDAAIASAVHRRGRWHRGDWKPVEGWQVALRALKYPSLFERRPVAGGFQIALKRR